MKDNILIENIEFKEEFYRNALSEDTFYEDLNHGIGDEYDGNNENDGSAE